MNNRKGMPQASKILSFWADRLIGQNAKYWLDVEYEYGILIKEATSVCFACGCNAGTERAHIVPLCKGGTNDITNLHLLCKECHTESEGFEEEGIYWEWFNLKSPSNSGSYLRLANKTKAIMSLIEKGKTDLIPADLLATLQKYSTLTETGK